MGSNENDEMDDIERLERRKRAIFQQYLDELRSKGNHLFALRAQMGETPSFISSVTLGWVDQQVRLADELPIWENKKEDEDGIISDEEKSEEMLQRKPDWSRQLPMVRYIAMREHHKFPPILVTAWQDWVSDDQADEWINKRAIQNSVNESILDSNADFIHLDCEKTNFYALDGQHRVMAIRGLKELLFNGILHGKKPSGEVLKNVTITLDDIIEFLEKYYPDQRVPAKARIQGLLDETIGIEIIPAVLKNETFDEALRRLRSTFVHVNRTAKALTKGALAQLDEDDGFVIVARRTSKRHELLRHNRVEMNKEQLQDSSFEYTTIVTLAKVAMLYLGISAPFIDWKVKKAGDLPFRPPYKQLDDGEVKLLEYFNALSKLPSHWDLIQNQEQSSAKYRKGELDNILFRPIAQMALAEAIGILVAERHINLNTISDKLKKAEIEQQLQLRNKQSIWFGVLCDVIDMKLRRKKFFQTLCTNLFIHLLGGGTPEEDREDLESKFREARITEDGKCIGLCGKKVPPEELKLPQPW